MSRVSRSESFANLQLVPQAERTPILEHRHDAAYENLARTKLKALRSRKTLRGYLRRGSVALGLISGGVALASLPAAAAIAAAGLLTFGAFAYLSAR